MKKIREILSSFGQKFNGMSEKQRDIRDYVLLEPMKFRKSMLYAINQFDDNQQAMDYIREEAEAYWKVIQILGQRHYPDELIAESFERGNARKDQSWMTSFVEGDMNWQMVLRDMEELIGVV